jgi:hypothetical protein
MRVSPSALNLRLEQTFIISTVSALSKKGYLGEYRWKEGESFDGKPWGEHLPSDAMVSRSSIFSCS